MRKKSSLLLALCLGVSLVSAAPPKAKDASEVSPDTHRVVLDNANVRVLEIRVNSGQKVPMHSHPAHLIVNLSPARVKFTYPDGKTELVDLRPGDAVWSDGVEHAAEALVGTVHIILVEVKGAKPTARP